MRSISGLIRQSVSFALFAYQLKVLYKPYRQNRLIHTKEIGTKRKVKWKENHFRVCLIRFNGRLLQCNEFEVSKKQQAGPNKS